MSTDKTVRVIELAPRYVNTATAAKLYGVSGDTLIAAVRAGKLRAKRSGENGGGLYLFKPEWLDAWADGLVDG
jgi:excisionase family DNA binding protein